MKRTSPTKSATKKTQAKPAKQTKAKPAKRTQPSKVRSNFNPRGALGATSGY